MQETQVWSLGWEDPLEKGMAIHSSILAWRIPRTEEPVRLQSVGLKRGCRDWATNTFTFTILLTTVIMLYLTFRGLLFKVFIQFVTMLLLLYVLVFWPLGLWDLSSPTRDWTLPSCIERQSLNHWTTRDVPNFFFFNWLEVLECVNLVKNWLHTYSYEVIQYKMQSESGTDRKSAISQGVRVLSPNH